MRSCMEEVKMLLKARCECLWITTYEEEEVINDLRNIVKRDFKNMKLFVWSNTEGLKGVPMVNGEKVLEPDVKLREIPALFAYIRDILANRNVNDNTGAVFVLRDLHNLMSDARTRRCIRDIKQYVQDRYIPLIVTSPTDAVHDEVARLFKVISYDLPDKKEILSIANIHNNRIIDAVAKGKTEYTPLSKQELVPVVNALAGLTVREIDNLLFQSTIIRKTLDLSYVNNYKIEAVKKSGVLDYRNPTITLNDIGGHKVLKDYLLEVKEQFSPAAREFGLPMPKGTLFLGLQGAGKTALAEAMAGTLGVPLLILNLSKVMSRFVGESEQRIEAALAVAKAVAPCCFLIDEMEKALGGVNSSNNTDSGITSRVFQSLLRFLQDNNKGVYFMMTSNDVSQLPPELTRAGRIDSQWFFDFPSYEDRKEIFKIHFRKRKKEISEDVISIAASLAENFTGAEIEEAVENTLRKAFLRISKKKGGKTDIVTEDIKAGIAEVTPIFESNRERVQALRSWAKGRVHFTTDTAEESRADSGLFDPLSNDLSL